MCGLAGFFAPRGLPSESGLADLRAMTGTIAHRGPDDDGVWIDGEAGIALGHRRLAIIDVSPLGHQPMSSADERWVIAFNGEIYNFDAIRAQLEQQGNAPAWRGHSDTEVLLAAISAWGIDAALRAAIGMFAFALWDRRDRRLFLARDRAGEKPLYYTAGLPALLFGSELKALRVHPAFDPAISREALAAYLRFGYVPGPLSIYEHVRKVEPGTYLAFSPGGEQATHRYWDLPVMASDGPAVEHADRELEALLLDAVGLQMRSDVPMGAFLSGGVDSSLIVAMMQRQSSEPVRTFSIGFEEAGFDEAKHAAVVARHLGTQHREMYVTARDALEVVPSLPSIYDEPFADSSQIPTFLLSKLTRAHVTVALSGDAGDELFGGYTRYFQGQQFARLWSLAPTTVRKALGSLLLAIPAGFGSRLNAIMPPRFGGLLTGARLPKIAAALQSPDMYAVYARLVSQWPNPQHIAPSLEEPPGWMDDQGLRRAAKEVVAWMMTIDFRTYLPDDILVKVDRASMATSLETRVPLLDHRVVEFAARLPLRQKIQHGVGKQVLRKILYRHVPRAMIERPKQGFGVPIAEWLRGPLRGWADDLLQKSMSSSDGFFDPGVVRQTWDRHLSGREDLHYPLWTLLMYQAWRE